MEIVEGKALDRADYITVKAKPGYSEKFIKDDSSLWCRGGGPDHR